MSKLSEMIANFMFKSFFVAFASEYVVVTDLKDEFYFSEPDSNEFKALMGDRVFTRDNFPDELVEFMKIGSRETLDEVLDSYNAILTSTE